MTPLEDQLRGSLARQAGHPSAAAADPDLLADRVIRRAHRVRWRRLGGATTVLALAVMGGLGPAYLPERADRHPVAAGSPSPLLTRSAPPPSPAATALSTPSRTHAQAREVARLPVDVLADHKLVTTDGRSIDVSFAGSIIEAYRVSAGWLVVGVPKQDALASLWLVAGNGSRRTLLSDVDGVALDPGGRRLAWRAGPRLWAGTLTAARISHREYTLVKGSVVPVGFVGDGILLARESGGYRMWWPDEGRYQAGWSDAGMRVYGTLSDGQTVVAQMSLPSRMLDKSAVTTPRRCLALLDATRALLPRTTACGLDLGARSPGAVSPDGRWLVTGSGGRTVLVDLTAPESAQPRVINATPPAQGGVVWLDEHTVVLAVGTGGVVVQLRLDKQSGRHDDDMKRWVVPVVAGKSVLVVPRLGLSGAAAG